MNLFESKDGFRFEFGWGAVVPVSALVLIATFRFGWRRGVLAAALLLLSLLLHECGHAAAAWLTHTPFSAIGLCAKGAYIRRQRAQAMRGEIFISLTGPTVNFILACLLWDAGPLANWLALMNLLLAVANLVPMKNSDGRRICDSLRELWAPPLPDTGSSSG